MLKMWTERSRSYWMPCTNGSQKGSFKLQEANFWGQGVGRRARSHKVPMIGSLNEITLSTALIDTGVVGFNYQSRTHTSLQFIADDIYA